MLQSSLDTHKNMTLPAAMLNILDYKETPFEICLEACNRIVLSVYAAAGFAYMHGLVFGSKKSPLSTTVEKKLEAIGSSLVQPRSTITLKRSCADRVEYFAHYGNAR